MITAYVWGDDTCIELDRFAPAGESLESTADPNLPADKEAEFIGFWESAELPWCVKIELRDESSIQDLVRTCDCVSNVAGYYISTDREAEIDAIMSDVSNRLHAGLEDMEPLREKNADKIGPGALELLIGCAIAEYQKMLVETGHH